MCVMVVENNFLVRLLLVEELHKAGLMVEEAEDADDALAVLAVMDQPLEVLVTDVHMRGRTDGLDLADHVRRRQPGVSVVFATACPDRVDQARLADGRQTVLAKPFSSYRLLDRVQKALVERV